MLRTPLYPIYPESGRSVICVPRTFLAILRHIPVAYLGRYHENLSIRWFVNVLSAWIFTATFSNFLIKITLDYWPKIS